jgi:hypothetical protein
MNNIFYVHAPGHDGLFLLNLDCDDSHINNIDANRCKLIGHNPMYMWHYRLGHIGVRQ